MNLGIRFSSQLLKGLGVFLGILFFDVPVESRLRGSKEKLHRAGVHHDLGGANTNRKFNCIARIALPHGQLLFVPGRGLEEIGCRVAHRRGQWAEVVRGRNLDEPFVDRLNDARHQRHTDAVAELGLLEAQLTDFLDHVVAVLMPVGQPAGGKGKAVFEGNHEMVETEKLKWRGFSGPR